MFLIAPEDACSAVLTSTNAMFLYFSWKGTWQNGTNEWVDQESSYNVTHFYVKQYNIVNWLQVKVYNVMPELDIR